MFSRNQVPDKELLKMVNRKLSRTGTGSQSHVTATIRQGTVTLSGKISYENQRTPLVKAVSSVPGVRSVTDMLQGPSKTAGQGH
jgi:osmotically-inducible protein OsmY